MAITSYSELLTALTNWRGQDTLQASRYPEWIALFEAWFNRNHRLRQMETSSASALSSNARTVPSDYLAWRSVEWYGITPHRELKWVHPKRLTSGWTAVGDGATTEFFTIESDTLTVAPADTANSTVLLRYYQKVPALTVSNTTNWLLTANPDLYLNGCLYEAAKLQRDVEAVALYKGARDEIGREMRDLSAMTQGEDAVRTSDYF